MSSRMGPSASAHHYRQPTSPLSLSPLTPSGLLMNASRRQTLAGSLPTMYRAVEGAGKAAGVDQREMDEKERVAERVKKALEADGQGIVEDK
jgi:hypothetical protein